LRPERPAACCLCPLHLCPLQSQLETFFQQLGLTKPVRNGVEDRVVGGGGREAYQEWWALATQLPPSQPSTPSSPPLSSRRRGQHVTEHVPRLILVGQHSTGQGNLAQHLAVQHRTAQHRTAPCSTTAPHRAAQHSTAQSYNALFCTAWHGNAQNSTRQDSGIGDHIRYGKCL
jgi:hypothetical protein